MPVATQKRCTGCGETKDLDDFYRDRSRADGRQLRCKGCQSGTTAQRERMARRRQRPDYAERAKVWARTTRLRRYGLTEADFVALVEDQANACAACRRDFTDEDTPRIDHDHDTGEVRGLLCNGCNVALGMLADDPVRISGLLIYLQGRP